jgi:hypothetical protein
MKKFSHKINESTNKPTELENGIKIESEHLDVYEYIDNYLQSYNVSMPCTKEEFYERIAKAHLKEIPDYYTRLKKMEDDK